MEVEFENIIAGYVVREKSRSDQSALISMIVA